MFLRDAWRDLRWGGRLLGKPRTTRFANKGAYNTEDTSYTVLTHLFTRVQPRPDDVIVDVGCGRGRVINYLLSRGVKNPIVGLELDPDVAANTARRLARHNNVRIIHGDAVANLPPEGTLFYLYNPFAEFVVRRLNARLARLDDLARVRVIYYNCLHNEPFERDELWQVRKWQVPRGRVAALITANGFELDIEGGNDE